MPRILVFCCAAVAIAAAGCVSTHSKNNVSKEEAGAGESAPDAAEKAPDAPGHPEVDARADSGATPTDASADRAADGPPARLPLGQACAVDGECGSEHCVSRVCCSTTCPAGAAPCGQDGTCDGNGRCRVPGVDVACGEERCASGSYTPPSRCDGNGRCATATAIACGSGLCQGSRCAGSCGAALPCSDPLYCDPNGQCQPKKPTSARCDLDSECAAGHCVEHVCCDAACNSPCRSCLATHTTGRDGQCAPIKAGVDPYDSCRTDPAASCLNDGFCDGAGGCRQHPVGTSCRGAACVDGASGSTASPPGECNGGGRCLDKGSAEKCDPYVCGATACKKACTIAGDCQPGTYCQAPRCLAQKPLGDVCNRPDECLTGFCGGLQEQIRAGRCCPSCVCPQPGTSNLLTNPGFDRSQSADSWHLEHDPSSDLRWDSTIDSDTCPYSGSLSAILGGANSATFYQCVPATADRVYFFGGSFRSPYLPETDPNGQPIPGGQPWQATCSLLFFSSMATCTAGAAQRTPLERFNLTVTSYVTTANRWFTFDSTSPPPQQSGFGIAPAGTNAVAFECFAVDDGAPDMTALRFDKLYLSTAGNRY